jgi:hypothetical protein
VRPGLDPEAENARVARTNPAGSSSRRRPPKPRPDGGGGGVGGDGGTVSAIHLCHSAEGGAGRAARRAVLACREAGLLAGFACVEGARHDPADLHLGVTKPAGPLDAALRESLHSTLQWGVIPQRRTGLSNTLLSVPCPGVDPDTVAPIAAADVLHLHWTSWMLTPGRIARWLAAGRSIAWTLHDFWPMTGGCHYPTGCEQYRTACLKCRSPNHGQLCQG